MPISGVFVYRYLGLAGCNIGYMKRFQLLFFNLIKGSSNDEYTLYASHSVWKSKNDFENWKKSKAFRAAHNSGGQHQGIYLGHPEFEGFEVVL